MSITCVSKESINGVNFTLIYNAVSTFVERNATKAVKSKSVREVAKKNNYSYCLHTTVGDHEFYAFAPIKGISFACQIEQFITDAPTEEVKEAASGVIIVALDERVYFAELEYGEIMREKVLILSAARDRINEISQAAKPIFWIAGGRCTADLDIERVGEEIAISMMIKSSAVRVFRYKSLAGLMTQNLLYHPTQLILTVPLVLAMVIGSIGYLNYRNEIQDAIALAKEKAAQTRSFAAAQRAMKTANSEANYSASVNLMNFLSVYGVAQTLIRDRAENITWQRDKVEISGTATEFPGTAMALGETDQWKFGLSEKGWTVQSRRSAVVDNQPVHETERTMHESFFSLAKPTHGELRIKQIERANGYEIILFRVSIPQGVSVGIAALSKAMKEKPYQLDKISCGFSGWAETGCLVEFTVKYEVAE